MASMVVILGARNDDDYAHGHCFSSYHHPSRAHAHRYSQQPPPPPSLLSSSYPYPSPPSPPRIWESGPHAAKVDFRRSCNGHLLELLLPVSAAAELEVAPGPGPASSLSSFPSSSLSTSLHSSSAYPHTSLKEDLFGTLVLRANLYACFPRTRESFSHPERFGTSSSRRAGMLPRWCAEAP